MIRFRHLFAAMLLILPLTVQAQDDDMYFVPKKKAKNRVEIVYEDPAPSVALRDVDEYNRRGSYANTFKYRSANEDTVYVLNDSTGIVNQAYAAGY